MIMNDRFASPTKEEVLNAASKMVVPTTMLCTKVWAVKKFTDWTEQWNKINIAQSILDVAEVCSQETSFSRPI